MDVEAIKTESINLVITLIYMPLDVRLHEFIEQLRNVVESYPDNIYNPALNTIFLSNFNLLHIKWKWLGKTDVDKKLTGNSTDKQLYKRKDLDCVMISLSEQIPEQTSTNTMQDLIFTNN